MKTFTAEDIERTRTYFEKEGYPQVKATLHGVTFRYYTLPPELNPELPHFVFRMTANMQNEGHLFGISWKVPERFRPYWVYHEVQEFLLIEPGTPDRCLTALISELELLPSELWERYIPARTGFFEHLVEYIEKHPQDYSAADLWEIKLSRDYLKILNREERRNNP